MARSLASGFAAVPLSVAMAGLGVGVAGKGGSVVVGPRELAAFVQWARGVGRVKRGEAATVGEAAGSGGGFQAVQIDATADGLRARQLDRSGLREIAAILRRNGAACSGLDLWVPAKHFVEPANQDRAVSAVMGTIEMAAAIASLAGSGAADARARVFGADGAVVCVRFPGEADGVGGGNGGMPTDVEATIAAHAMAHGVRIADHRWPPVDAEVGGGASGGGGAGGAAAGVVGVAGVGRVGGAGGVGEGKGKVPSGSVLVSETVALGGSGGGGVSSGGGVEEAMGVGLDVAEVVMGGGGGAAAGGGAGDLLGAVARLGDRLFSVRLSAPFGGVGGGGGGGGRGGAAGARGSGGRGAVDLPALAAMLVTMGYGPHRHVVVDLAGVGAGSREREAAAEGVIEAWMVGEAGMVG